LECSAPTLTLNGINRKSAGNYRLKDEESTRGRGFHRELPVHLLGFRPVRSKFVENPLNGNRIQDQQIQILYTDNTNFKMKNKPDQALLGTSYLSK
jgi:hypothetical protein